MQVVGAQGRRRRIGENMNESELSAADAALRQRLTELCVHIPCGGIRGPVRGRWQSCTDEDSPAEWGCDVSRDVELCVVCFRATAGGRSRWSWLACGNCLNLNSGLEKAWGIRPLALGRHSIMNGITVNPDAPPEIYREQIERMMEFARGDELRQWRREEYARLAAPFDPLADVPLRVWREQWPPSRSASLDAMSRLLGCALPLC